MPMTWNAEADAKLFATILKIHDVKLDLAKIAAEMGPECTAKALSHRIAKLKKDGASAGQSPSPAKAAPKPSNKRGVASTQRKPTSKKGKNDNDEEEQDSGKAEEDDEEEAKEPVTKRVKREEREDSGLLSQEVEPY